MFISTEFLAINYGVDDKIAKFFVDREPPSNNLYWHNKLLYLRPTPGYLFIPLVVDLLFRIGVSKDELLSERFVSAMERIGHISALEETGQISKEEAVQQCQLSVEEICVNKDWFIAVSDYLTGGKNSHVSKFVSPYKALHRGDVFLFSLSVVNFNNQLQEQIIRLWFALITTLLLLDDAEDFKADKESGEENAFVESGLDEEGLAQVKALLVSNLETIKIENPVMARQLYKQYIEQVENTNLLSVK